MTPRRAAAQRQPDPEPSLPGVLIAPGNAAPEQREAYWIELLDNPEELRKAIGTTEFFPLLRDFPASLWGDRLSIYVYRLPDDDGMQIKNELGSRKYIKPILRHPVDEEWLANKHGGGKYLLYLKLDNKASIKETTVRIDGAPKLQAGQTVEIDGKFVPVNGGAAAASAQAESRSDVASVIQASSDANKQNMEILAEGSKAAIALVREQATAATKPDAQSGLMDKFLTVMIERMMNPPTPPAVADPIDTFVKLQGLIQKNNPEPTEPKDPPLEEAMTLVEKFAGKSFSELMKGNRGAPAVDAGPNWGAIALGVAEKFFAVAPTLFQQAIYSRQQEFQRAVWLRTAKPGEAPPPALLAVNVPQINPPNANDAKAPNPPGPQPDSAAVDPMALTQHIVQMVCHGFDQDPYSGGETAAAICFSFGRMIEAAGIEAMLADEESIKTLVVGNQLLQQRSQHAKWAQFQEDFLAYMGDRFGAGELEKPGPQPVA